ncbi:hypothetical protein C5B91_09330 [Haloferax sp. Atlit-10N]|uniref:hypothetical protein n=1 Tax=unclassified Haloferax TaxID=2625095 RepID=UPI000E24AC13|nr:MULTISPECIES: hypothetical protein [unclassified Haloferax]RDZ44821.1 hypothetical protein C5B87_11640 [Haloferax sp. Atlit-16N]RDZ59400.1 hypothetical protein C5B91_09330 [Haloferax sp. Atlit-10N]
MEVVRNVRELTAVLEQFSETTGEIHGLELTSGDEPSENGTTASVTVEYDFASACAVDPDRLSVSSPAASMTDGRLRLELDVALAPPATEDAGQESVSAEHAGTDGDPEPADAPVARADGSGARGSTGSAPVASVVSPPTMEFAVPTARDEPSEDDQPTSVSTDDPIEADTETDANTATETSPDTETDADTGTKTETSPTAATDADSVPAHHDPVRLREAYETCETFKEMTDALGVDVTPQTVRNQMIQRGIHEPESYGESTESGDEPRQPEPSVSDEDSTSETDQSPKVGTEDTDDAAVERDTPDDAETDANDESKSVSESKPDPKSAPNPKSESQSDSETDPATNTEQVATETDETSTTAEDASTATDLPPLPASVSSLDCSTEDVCAAVAGAKTLYEVERRLGLDRADVRELLAALDLLDLVTGRMARRDQSAASPDDVRTRVHAALGGEGA